MMGEARSRLGAFGRVALATGFLLAPRLAFACEFHGLEYVSRLPHAYFAISHKRDFDVMIPLGRILWRRGWASLTYETRFAMRSDAFEPGFLARIVLRPRWVSRLLRPISVGPVLRALGVFPLTDYGMRPIETWIREHIATEGDAPAGEILAPPILAAIAAATQRSPDEIARLPLSALLTWRYHAPLQERPGPEVFTGLARRQAERRVTRRARGELEDIAAWLRAGGSLYGSPEGRLSPDGRLSPITSGLHRVLRGAPGDTHLIPIMIVYDSLTTHRRRMFVDLSPAISLAIEAAATLAPRALDGALVDAWRAAGRFTCTQLGAAFLVRQTGLPGATFTRREMSAAICAEARLLAQKGRRVDARLLRERGARERARGFLAAAVRCGAAKAIGRGRYQVTLLSLRVDVPAWDVGYRRFPLAYAWNEYRDLMVPSSSLSDTPEE